LCKGRTSMRRLKWPPLRYAEMAFAAAASG
jgi:hypothetical protein